MWKKTKSFLIILFLGLIGLGAYLFLYDKYFPQASIKFGITSQQAKTLAREYLIKNDYAIDDYKEAVDFFENTNEVIYLQKAYGIKQLNNLFNEDKDLTQWGYSVRFFRPLQKEEYSVFLNQDGSFRALVHSIEEKEFREFVSIDEAKTSGFDYALTQSGLTEERLELMEQKDKKLDNRTDYSFTWKEKDSEIELAGYQTKADKRFFVLVRGGKIDGYSSYLHIPEDFTRALEKETSLGTIISVISLGLTVVLYIFAFFIFLKNYKRNNIRLKIFHWIVLVIIILTLVTLVDMKNSLYMNYTTSIPLGIFSAIMIVTFVLGLLFIPVGIYLPGTAGENLTREIYPDRNIFDYKKPFPKQKIFSSAVRGMLYAGMFLGVVSLFYYLGFSYLKIWAPLQTNVSDAVTTVIPFLAPLLVAFSAAFSEELIYRLYAVSFLKKYLKWTFLALFIPAIIWAAGHGNYQIYPSYIRVIELTIVGLLWGIIFIKNDILTTIVAHFFYNAILLATPLIVSQNLYFRISGIFVAAILPLLMLIYKLKYKVKFAV